MEINELNQKLDQYLDNKEKQCIDETAILEMATIVTLSNGNHNIRHIGVNPDRHRNWENIEYFKIYDTTSVVSATKLARIKFRIPEYEVHEGSNWILNNKQKKELISILKDKCTKFPGLETNWQYAIYQFNNEAHEDSNYEDCIRTQAQLDELPDGDERKTYLPIDLPMPNYMEL